MTNSLAGDQAPSNVVAISASADALLANLFKIHDALSQHPDSILEMRHRGLLEVLCVTVQALSASNPIISREIWDSIISNSFKFHEQDDNALAQGLEDLETLSSLRATIETAFNAAATAPTSQCADVQHQDLLCESRASGLER